MKQRKTIYHLIVDKSGSMIDCIDSTINGFNEQVISIKQKQLKFEEEEITMGLTTFNHFEDHHYFQSNPSNLQSLNYTTYRPDGSTALLDAIGKSIYDIKTQFGHEIEENQASVVLIIITDGYENASRFYTYGDIQRMVKELEATEKWNFTFMGADLDAMSVSQNMEMSLQMNSSMS